MNAPNASSLFQIHGWLEYRLRNDADGSIIREGSTKNVYTTWGLRTIFNASNFGSYITISDDERPAAMKDAPNIFLVDGKSPSASQNPSVSFDAVNLTTSRVASFASPATARTVRKVLFGFDEAHNNNKTVGGVAAYMEISPPIVQSPGATLELVYRQQFVVPTVKSMKRWASAPMLNQKRTVQAFLQYQNLNSGDYWRSGFGTLSQHGKFYFADEGARYGMHWYGGYGAGNQTAEGSDSWLVRPYSSGSGSNPTNNGSYAALTWNNNFSATYGNSSNMVGAIGSGVAFFHGSTWQSDDTWGGSSEFRSMVGFYPMRTSDGDLSTVFQHPVGETYLFNVAGSVPEGQGAMLLKGPYRPDDQILPASYAYRVKFTASGGTDSGTEGEYRFTRGWMNRTDGYFNGNTNLYGIQLRQLHTTFDAAKDPEVVYAKNSLAYDGRGYYWATARGAGEANRLYVWKGFTHEQILNRVESDDTRWYGIIPGDEQVSMPWSTDAGSMLCVATLCSDENGVIFYPTRMDASGQQAIHVIDNQRPGRYYQRPSGSVTTGSNNFSVSTSDEIHAMFPFVAGSTPASGIGAGDVGRQIRIVGSANGNDGVRTITAWVDANTVTLSGAPFTAESGLTWHWVTVYRRTSVNGLVSRIRVLKYDKINLRLWAWTDAGLQCSDNYGLTWSALINNDSGDLTDVTSERCQMPDGKHANNTCAIGNSGELYWTDTGGGSASGVGLNKYVPGLGGPGGTHTRLAYSSFPNYRSDRPLCGIGYDPVAPDLSTTEGALWLGTVFAHNTFWRLRCDNFSIAHLQSWTSPQVNGASGHMDYSVQHIAIGPGGAVALSDLSGNGGWPNVGYNYDTGTFVFFTIYPMNPADIDTNYGQGSTHIRDDGTMVHMPSATAKGNASRGTVEYFWESGSSKWIPWVGTVAQFTARYGGNGSKKCHADYQMLFDNVRVAFIQNGAVLQTEEYKVDESFTFLGAMGLHRTNIQDLTSTSDITLGSLRYYLEDQPIKIVPSDGGAGNVRLYYAHAVFGGWSVLDPQRPLGSGSNFIPEVVGSLGGYRMGAVPSGYPALLQGQASGVVPDTHNGGDSHAGWMAGLDLGTSEPVAKVRVTFYDSQPEQYGTHALTNGGTYAGRTRLYCSDDNATWVEVTAARWIAKDTSYVGSGSSASIVDSGVPGYPDLTGLDGFTAGSDALVAGQSITISSASSAANNGTFTITQVNSSTSVRIENPSAVPGDANNGSIVWDRPLDVGYKYVHHLNGVAQVSNDPSSWSNAYHQITFDLLGAGLNIGARTHRYWKVVHFDRAAEAGNNNNHTFALSGMCALGDDGYAVGIPSAARLPEAGNVDLISAPIRQFMFIQDRKDTGVKAGIDSVADSYADGFTDTVTISASPSSTFNTGAINPLTDYLAYHHPVTGTFLRNDTGQVAAGHPGAVGGEQTQVKILSVTGTTIVVEKRNIPVGLSDAYWEVRRPGISQTLWPTAPGEYVAPFAGDGYIKFHSDDAGREYRVVQRVANLRP